MLYILYTPPDRVKFSEYIAHFLVRASSQKKARDFVAKAYPNHPLPVVGADGLKFTRCAPVAKLARIQTVTDDEELQGSTDFIYATDEANTEREIRETLASARWPNTLTSELLLCANRTFIREIPANGKAGVLARAENVTSMLNQKGKLPLFCWKPVTPSWPNPVKDPNLVPSEFMKPEITKAQSLESFAEQEAELIERLMQQ